jgi:hypothetical protein
MKHGTDDKSNVKLWLEKSKWSYRQKGFGVAGKYITGINLSISEMMR